MAGIDDPGPVLDQTAAEIDRIARRAFEAYQARVLSGQAPREAIADIMAGFGGQLEGRLRAAFEQVLQRAVGTGELRALPVGEITLARALYRNRKLVERQVQTIVAEHARAQFNTDELARKLFEGYSRAPFDPLKAKVPLRRELRELLSLTRRDPEALARIDALRREIVSTRLRTKALEAAYLQAFKAAIEPGTGKRLEKALEVAIYERNRYFANRIAQTELARAHWQRVAEEFWQDDEIAFVQWRINPAHPATDICDLFAGQDRFGLGAGIYPKGRAPVPPAHPHCRCRLVSRPDLTGLLARERPGSERAFLRGLSGSEARQVIGSREKLRRVLEGADVMGIVNKGRPAQYRMIDLADKLGQPAPIPPKPIPPKPIPPKPVPPKPVPPKPGPAVPPKPPTPPKPIAPAPAPAPAPVKVTPADPFALPAFRPAKTVAEAEEFAAELLTPGRVKFQKLSDGTPCVRYHHDGFGSGYENAGKKLFGWVRFEGLDLETANAINEWLVEAQAKCDALGIPRLRGIRTFKTDRFNASMGDGVLTVKQGISAKAADRYGSTSAEALARRKEAAERFNRWNASMGSTRTGYGETSINMRPWVRSEYFADPVDGYRSMLWHEFGHHIHQQLGVTTPGQYIDPPVERFLEDTLGRRRNLVFPTQYSNHKPSERKEYFAECFGLFKMGKRDKVPDYMIELFEQIEGAKGADVRGFKI